MNDELRTAALARETVEHLTRMADICRTDLPNVAAKMDELAAKWKRSMWFDGSAVEGARPTDEADALDAVTPKGASRAE